MSRPAGPPIGRLVVAHVVIAAGALLLAPGGGPDHGTAAVVAGAVAFALGFAVVGSHQMHIELRRHACAVTLVEAALVVALLWLSPLAVVVAATAGEAMACVVQRQTRRQITFNASAAAASVAVAAAAFTLLTDGDRRLGTLVAGALAAAVCYGLASLVSTVAVLAVVEARRFRDLFATSVVPAAVATMVSSSIGVVAVVLTTVHPAAAGLVAPLVAMMILGTRGLAAQRAEQLRFERLYEASSRTGGLQSLPDVLTTLAAEARELVTGASAVCATVAPGGSWTGMLVDDGEPCRVPRAMIDALRADHPEAEEELATDGLPAAWVQLLAGDAPVGSVTIVHATDGAAPVLLVVARSLGTDRGAKARTEVLAAFAGHAALTIANARLYADVEDALARQVDLNRQKDDFVAVVSHELRTPLTSMIGAVSSLHRSRARLDEERMSMLTEMAMRQGRRLQQLIEELLLLATVEHGAEPTLLERPVDLGAMVAEIAADLAANSDAGFDVDVVLDGPGVAITDEAKLRQILINLLENARKYAPGSPVHVQVAQGIDRVVVDVVDEGPGIEAEDRERVFERFVQLDQTATRAVGGTGLGLYLCRQLARVLGGSLVLSEADGGGCCFTLTLPLPVPAAEPPAAEPPAAESSAADPSAVPVAARTWS